MKKLIILVLCCFMLTSCPYVLSKANYYLQQQGSEIDGGGTGGGGGGTDGGGTIEPEDLSVITMFQVLQADGAIVESLFGDNDATKLAKLKEVLPVVQYPELTGFRTADFINKRIDAKFSAQSVPEIWYVNGVWEPSSDTKYLSDTTKDKYSYRGSDTSAGSNDIFKVIYYMYDGKNPFYTATGNYNTATYTHAGKTETLLNRFMFYRFSGKGGGAVLLDNMLVAVDTYTRLIFSFGKPTKFVEIIEGQPYNPTVWEAVEAVTTAPDGKKYKFYEYDPAGYVGADGKFIMENWYLENLAQANVSNTSKYDPQFTGISPYLIKLSVSFTPVITATTLEIDGELKDENGKLYTEISLPKFTQDIIYNIYRMDDASGGWSENPIKTIVSPKNEIITYRDYDALTLTSLPQYKVVAKNANSEVLGESEPVIGSRMLTKREMLLASIETIRLAVSQLWYKTGSLRKNKLVQGSATGTMGTYYHGITWTMPPLVFIPNGTAYKRYQRFDNYKNTLLTINGTFMQNKSGGSPLSNTSRSGIYSHTTSGWTSNSNFKPRTDSLTASFSETSIDIAFNNIKIDNNNGNAPAWSSGSFLVVMDGKMTEYDKDSGIPFGFFMDSPTFRSKIVGEGYTQQ